MRRHTDIHVHVTSDTAVILAKLNELENTVSDLSSAIAAQREALIEMAARIDEDFANITALLEQALATPPDAQAEIDRLTAEVAELQADAAEATAAITASIAKIEAEDPDPSNPAGPPEVEVDVPHPDNTLPGDLPAE